MTPQADMKWDDTDSEAQPWIPNPRPSETEKDEYRGSRLDEGRITETFQAMRSTRLLTEAENRVALAEQSRDKWLLECQTLQAQVARLQAQVRVLEKALGGIK